MIQAWQDTVKPQDHVWHLGDFMIHQNGWAREECIKIGKRLAGHKSLVLGNHDRLDVRTYRDAGFQKVLGAKELHTQGMRLLFSHYPLHQFSLFKRDACIHGHIHEKASPPAILDHDGKIKRWFNVSVERIGYKPIHVDELVKLLQEQQPETTPGK